MTQDTGPFDFNTKDVDSGSGAAAGFGVGVAVYAVTWILFLVIADRIFPAVGAADLGFALLVAQLFINGCLIWRALGNNRKRFARGLIICASLVFLLDSACWARIR
jgi:hypothetical protein